MNKVTATAKSTVTSASKAPAKKVVKKTPAESGAVAASPAPMAPAKKSPDALLPPVKPTKPAAPVAEASKPAATEKTVSLSDLCDKLKVKGLIARRVLRGSGVKKPGKSWTWPAGHADIAKVEALFTKKPTSTVKPAAKTTAAKSDKPE